MNVALFGFRQRKNIQYEVPSLPLPETKLFPFVEQVCL